MHLDRRDAAGLAIVALSAVASAVAAPALPDQLAIHFDASGRPDGYLAKPVALVLLPLVSFGLVALFSLLPRVDPLGENVADFQRYYDLVAVVAVGAPAYVHGLVLARNLGFRFPVGVALAPLLAVTYYVVGRVIENAERNWFVGVRTPWTLSDDDVWRETHDRTGILFKLAGGLALLAIPFPGQLLLVAVVPVAVAALVATAYSFVVYRRLAPE